jgi:hypothetical protein
VRESKLSPWKAFATFRPFTKGGARPGMRGMACASGNSPAAKPHQKSFLAIENIYYSKVFHHKGQMKARPDTRGKPCASTNCPLRRSRVYKVLNFFCKKRGTCHGMKVKSHASGNSPCGTAAQFKGNLCTKQ